VALLCAGTGGAVAMEDVIGAGAVMDALSRLEEVRPASDVAVIAQRLFRSARNELPAALAESRGGRNVVNAGLAPDIDFAANLDLLDVVGVVQKEPLAVRALTADS
jgi:phosphosulfolactate phosphohydrolase-like enzyme